MVNKLMEELAADRTLHKVRKLHKVVNNKMGMTHRVCVRGQLLFTDEQKGKAFFDIYHHQTH